MGGATRAFEGYHASTGRIGYYASGRYHGWTAHQRQLRYYAAIWGIMLTLEPTRLLNHHAHCLLQSYAWVDQLAARSKNAFQRQLGRGNSRHHACSRSLHRQPGQCRGIRQQKGVNCLTAQGWPVLGQMGGAMIIKRFLQRWHNVFSCGVKGRTLNRRHHYTYSSGQHSTYSERHCSTFNGPRIHLGGHQQAGTPCHHACHQAVSTLSTQQPHYGQTVWTSLYWACGASDGHLDSISIQFRQTKGSCSRTTKSVNCPGGAGATVGVVAQLC